MAGQKNKVLSALERFERFFAHYNFFELLRELCQRIFHDQALEARRADEPDAIGVRIDVGGVLRGGDVARSAATQ